MHGRNYFSLSNNLILHKIVNINQSNMFKQSKKHDQLSSQQNLVQAPATNYFLKQTQTLPKQLLQFVARQITIIKDISHTCTHNHPDIVASRLVECAHLMQKKLACSLGDNPEQYHDYIQDFYEDQLNSLRNQLNFSKLEISKLKKELDQMKNNYDMLAQEKQSYVKLSGRELQMDFDQISQERNRNENIYNMAHYEQNGKLKKQLDHCRLLLQENSSFIQQQARAIQNLSTQLKSKQKQLKTIREQYEQKIIQFDQFINSQTLQCQSLSSTLASEHKSYQQLLKQLTFTKVRILDERAALEKQLEIKVEEIHLLTKKVLEDQMIITKLDRTLTLKQKMIEQLYQEIDSVQGNISRIGKKEEDFQKLYHQKKEFIQKLQESIKNKTEANEKLQKKLMNMGKKVQQFNEENKLLEVQLQQSRSFIKNMEIQLQSLRKKGRETEKNLSKINNEKQNLEEQMKSIENKFEEAQKRRKQQKKEMKREILGQMNELVSIVDKNMKQIKKLVVQKEQLNVELKKQMELKNRAEENYFQINQLNTQIQRQVQFLQSQNKQLKETIVLLQKQLSKMHSLVEKLQRTQKQHQVCVKQKKSLADELRHVKQQQNESMKSYKSISQNMSQKQCELSQTLNQSNRQHNQKLMKKDFQLKQMDSKIKTLQEEARANSKLYENQKVKMIQKIRQLEELLKQRYELSSRFSQTELHTGEDYSH